MMFKAEAYVIEGHVLENIWQASERFNDGTKMTPDERRDLAQRIQAQLRHAFELDVL